MSVMSCGWKSLYGHLWSQPAPLWALCLREAANQCEIYKDCFGLWFTQSYSGRVKEQNYEAGSQWLVSLCCFIIFSCIHVYHRPHKHRVVLFEPLRVQSSWISCSVSSAAAALLSRFWWNTLISERHFKIQEEGTFGISWDQFVREEWKRAAGERREAKGAQWELWPETSCHLGNSSFCWAPAGWTRLKYQVACWICEMKPLASASPFSLAEMIRWRLLWLKLVHLVQLDGVKVSSGWRRWLQMEDWFLQKVDSNHVDTEFSVGETSDCSWYWCVT